MNSPDPATSKSPGNEGSRGSRGVGNSGAKPDEVGGHEPAPERPANAGTEGADARGGGGIGSASDRSGGERDDG